MDHNLDNGQVHNEAQVLETQKVSHQSSNKFGILKNKKLLVLILIMLAIPLTVALALIQKDTQSHADASTMVSFNPSKLEAVVGRDVELAVYVTPGGNLINSLKLGINYDPNYFEVVGDGFTVDSASPLTIVNGPMTSNGMISVALSSGSDPTKVIKISTRVGFVTLRPIKATDNNPGVISFSPSNTIATSISEKDALNENVISSAIPANIYVSQDSLDEGIHRVFITSTYYDGNLGGLQGADAICQERASSAQLGGQWKAWMSDSKTSASSRQVHASVPYKTLNGATVAWNWKDLTDGTLQNPINITEFKQVKSAYVWTGSYANGELVPDDASGSQSCKNWTSKEVETYGVNGSPVSVTQGWSYGGSRECSDPANNTIYCIDQTTVPDFGPTISKAPTVTPTITIIPTVTPSLTSIITPITTKVTLNPNADSFVRSTAPTTNFGTSAALENDLSPDEISFIRFNLATLAGKNIKSAKLILWVSDPTNSTLNLRNANDSDWSEAGITYNNKPAFVNTVASFTAKSKDAKVVIDVTSRINSKKGTRATFGIKSIADDAGAFYSRNALDASKRPKLIVEY